MTDSYEWSGMKSVEEATHWTDIPALNLTAESENRERSGGERTVIEVTMTDRDCRTLIENIAVTHHVMIEVLAAVQLTDSSREQFLHSMCWQAVRNTKQSLFLAMSGWYSAASSIQRGVLETIGTAIDIADTIESNKDEGWARLGRWVDGNKKASPSGNDIAHILSNLVPDISELIHRNFEQNREERNRHVHTPVGGQVYDAVWFGEPLTRPWMSSVNERKLKAWYVGSLTDIFILLRVVLELFDFNGIPESCTYILKCYEGFDDYEAEGIITDHTVDISPD